MEFEIAKRHIDKALAMWNFDLAKQCYEKYQKEFKELEPDYLDFCLQRADFDSIQSFLHTKITCPAWWSEQNLGISFENLKKINNANLKDNFEILPPYVQKISLLKEKIQNNTLNKNDVWALSVELRCFDKKISRAEFIASVIDYFSMMEDEDFFYYPVVHSITNFFHAILDDLQNYFEEEDGAKVYYSKITLQLRAQFLKQDQMPRKVAICFYGALRGNWKGGLELLIQKVAKPLNADCFLFTWDEFQIYPSLCGGGWWAPRILKHKVKELAPEEIIRNEGFFKFFGHTASKLSRECYMPLSQEDMQKFMQENPSFKGFELQDIKQVDFRNQVWGAPIYYGIYKSLEVMKKYEQKHHFEYDFVVVLRPDLDVIMELDVEDLKSMKINEISDYHVPWGTSSGYAYGRRDTINAYATLYEKLPFLWFKPDGNHSTYFFWGVFNQFEFVKQKIVPIFNGNNPAYEGIKFPDFKEELEKDLARIRQEQIFDEAKIQSFIIFFDTLIKEYRLITDKDNVRIVSAGITLSNYKGAKARIKNQLSYKLGLAMIEHSKSMSGALKMPFVLKKIASKHKEEQKNLKKQNLKLPTLESYADYQEALKAKEHLPYKLGSALMKAYNNAWGGGLLLLPFKIRSIIKEHKEQKFKKG